MNTALRYLKYPLQTLTDILERDYHQIILWKLVSFIGGILYYFHLPLGIPWQLLLLLNLVSLVLWLWPLKDRILLYTCKIFVVFFILGLTCSKIRITTLTTVTLKDTYHTLLIAQIDAMHPSRTNTTLYLKEVYIPLFAPDETPKQIRLKVPIHYARRLNTGDVVMLKAELMPPLRSILPEGYDFGLNSLSMGIGAAGRLTSNIHILESGQPQTIQQTFQHLRYVVYQHLLTNMQLDSANFASALMIGESGGISEEIMQMMRAAGVSHILCVSGLHLSLVALTLFKSCRFILNLSNDIAFRWNIKLISGIIALIGSLFYLCLSGMQIAATRAFLMVSISMIAVLLQRTSTSIRSINIVALLTLAFNPEYLFLPSFQLSYLAVLSLIAGYDIVRILNSSAAKPKNFLSKIKLYLLSNIYSTLLASLGTAPVVAYNFFLFSNYSLLANLVVVPLVSVLLMPMAVMAFVAMPLKLDKWLLQIMEYIISFIIGFAHKIAQLPYAVWHTGHISGSSVVLYLFGFFWLAFWQTTWRLLGLIAICYSLFAMYNTQYPDIVIDRQHETIGINKGDVLNIFGQGELNDFFVSYWATWFGQTNYQYVDSNVTDQNHVFVTKCGARVVVIFDKTSETPNLTRASVILNYDDAILPPLSSDVAVLSRNQLISQDPLLVFCKDKFTCKVKGQLNH